MEKERKRTKFSWYQGLKYQGSSWEFGAILLPFLAMDQIDSNNLEDRLKNLKDLEKEKCKNKIKEDTDEYFSK